MAEELIHVSGTREEKYKTLLPQMQALVTGERDLTANLANLAAAIKETFDFLWVGFYLVKEDELVLGPFQGPIACTRIRMGKGVCGTAWERKESLLVGDVNAFPGHIACSSRSQSELVVPLKHKDDTVWGVLDLDSEQLNDFSETDKNELEHFFQWFSGQL
ncbi:MAG: GAF domain-containing protein [Cryomorphaceae bacterium]|jgi:GAF domain-containing protein|nr:GAF domain-containing protein [Cryomorphaceae bacterium]